MSTINLKDEDGNKYQWISESYMLDKFLSFMKDKITNKFRLLINNKNEELKIKMYNHVENIMK